jgi:hypothetical protein
VPPEPSVTFDPFFLHWYDVTLLAVIDNCTVFPEQVLVAVAGCAVIPGLATTVTTAGLLLTFSSHFSPVASTVFTVFTV